MTANFAGREKNGWLIYRLVKTPHSTCLSSIRNNFVWVKTKIYLFFSLNSFVRELWSIAVDWWWNIQCTSFFQLGQEWKSSQDVSSLQRTSHFRSVGMGVKTTYLRTVGWGRTLHLAVRVKWILIGETFLCLLSVFMNDNRHRHRQRYRHCLCTWRTLSYER